MDQTSEFQKNDDDSLIEFFKFNATKGGTSASSTYSKAVNSLVGFLQSSDVSLVSDPETALCDWMVHMCVGGVALSTALPYLNSVSGLYKKAVGEGLAPHTDVFKRLKRQLKEDGALLWSHPLCEAGFDRLRNLARAVGPQPPVQKLLVYTLACGCVPLAQAALVKITDISDEQLEQLDIRRSEFSGNRRYVFQMNQSVLTPAQLLRTVNDEVSELLRQKDIPRVSSADATLHSYWAYAALRMGVAPHTVRSYFETIPSGLPILAVCRRRDISEEFRNEITAGVAVMFTANPHRWYVMRLRPRVRFKDLEQKFECLSNVLPKPELFYPCEEIRRRVGKKTATVMKPVIPDIVFFKCRETEVYPMFLKIGDVAWCYRKNGMSGNAYAPIPKRAFETFQETICQFTPDYEVASIGELSPQPGDKVIVVGGLFQNQEGTLKKIEDKEEGGIIYRIEITPQGGIPLWKIGVDARIVRKASGALRAKC